MELFIVIGLPILTLLAVFAFFRRDLSDFREAGKLKVGALEAFVQRHRKAVMLHFGFLIVLLPLMIFALSGNAVIGALLLTIVFLGHVSALNRMSRPIIDSLKLKNDYHARLKQLKEPENSEAFEETELAKKESGK